MQVCMYAGTKVCKYERLGAESERKAIIRKKAGSTGGQKLKRESLEKLVFCFDNFNPVVV